METVAEPEGGVAGFACGGCPYTPRVCQVLELIALGHSDKVIARQLRISARTVADHIQTAIERSGCGKGRALVVFAVRHADICRTLRAMQAQRPHAAAEPGPGCAIAASAASE